MKREFFALALIIGVAVVSVTSGCYGKVMVTATSITVIIVVVKNYMNDYL